MYYSFLKIVRYDKVSIDHLESKWLVMNWKCFKQAISLKKTTFQKITFCWSKYDFEYFLK